jgi:hypothetical protein
LELILQPSGQPIPAAVLPARSFGKLKVMFFHG